MAKPQFDPKAFEEAVARARDGRSGADENPRPTFDPKQHKEVVEDFTRRGGFKADDFKTVLEHYGFRWYEAPQCPRLSDGTRPKEGQWRSQKFEMAFTNNDLLASFQAGPQEFHAWIQEQITRKRARAAGLILPS